MLVFFSCSSPDCHDCSTPGLKRRNHSDDADEVGEIPMQIDHDLESQINSWVYNDDMHEDDQSSVHLTTPLTTLPLKSLPLKSTPL